MLCTSEHISGVERGYIVEGKIPTSWFSKADFNFSPSEIEMLESVKVAVLDDDLVVVICDSSFPCCCSLISLIRLMQLVYVSEAIKSCLSAPM